jgi:hypothetical protein
MKGRNTMGEIGIGGISIMLSMELDTVANINKSRKVNGALWI